jgi:hypothetical protein
MIGIYKITEIATGLCYIGQSIRCHGNNKGRWLEHYKRFPPALFAYEVLIQCPEESLNFFEKSFINGYDSHRNGFNGTIGGSGIKATHASVETRKKLSAVWKGRKRAPFSDDHRAKLSENAKVRMQGNTYGSAMKGIPQSPEHIAARVEGKRRAKAAKEELNVQS